MSNLWTRVAEFVIKYHKGIVMATIILVALSIISAGHIQVTTKMKDLLPQDNPQVQMMDEVEEQFSGGTSLFITVEGEDRYQMIACAEAVVEEVESRADLRQYIRAINLKVEKDFVTEWGFLWQEVDDLTDSRETFAQLNILPFLTALNDSFEETYIDNSEEELSTSKQENEAVAMFAGLELFFTLLREYMVNPETVSLPEQGEKLAEVFLLGEPYAFSPDNTMLLFTISPKIAVDDIELILEFMEGIQEVIEQVQKAYPQLEIGYTGDVAMQADEQYAMHFDMLVPSLVALGVIVLLFIFSLRPVRVVFFAIISLVVGIVLNYGLIGITLREINMLTSIMGALLIGLGIDYGLQVATNFSTYRGEGHTPAEALRLTYAKAGMGTLLAALTTAVAFFVLAFTGSESLSQFGMIAGTGIITCFLAMILVLPSLLYWFGGGKPAQKGLPVAEYRFLAPWSLFMQRNRVTVLVVGAILTGVFSFTIFLNRFNLDIIALEPQHMPSIIGYHKVMDKFGLCPMSALAITDNLEEARALTKVLEEENYISQVESIATYVPALEEQEERLAEVKKIREMGPRYRRISYTPADLESFAGEVQRLEWNVIETGDLSVAGLGENNKIMRKRDYMIREILGAETGKPGKEVFQRLISVLEEDPVLYADRLSFLDPYFARAMDAMISTMAAVNRGITVADLPDRISNHLVSADGKQNLITAYPQQHIINSENGIGRFAQRMEKLSPKITGTPQVIISWLEEIMDGTVKAGVYIIIVIFLFLLLSFQSLRRALLALVPLAAGMIWMLGLHPLLGWRLNLINVAVTPLIIGMGIDYGVHIVHRYTVEIEDIETVFRYTAKGILLSALTTMIGFGSLGLIGSFNAVASIGALLFLGIATCLVAALTITPALLGSGRKQASKEKIRRKKAVGEKNL